MSRRKCKPEDERARAHRWVTENVVERSDRGHAEGYVKATCLVCGRLETPRFGTNRCMELPAIEEDQRLTPAQRRAKRKAGAEFMLDAFRKLTDRSEP